MRTSRILVALRRLCRGEQGVAAVELALVAPFFFTFMIGTIELCLVMFVNIGIEAAVRDGARYGITGSAPSGVTREDQLRAIIAERTVGLIDMAKVQISTKVYPTFTSVAKPETYTDSNGNGQWDPGEPLTDINGNGIWDEDPGVPGMGGAGQIVLYTITYGTPLISKVAAGLFGTDTLQISTRTVVRNEPWNPS